MGKVHTKKNTKTKQKTKKQKKNSAQPATGRKRRLEMLAVVPG